MLLVSLCCLGQCKAGFLVDFGVRVRFFGGEFSEILCFDILD